MPSEYININGARYYIEYTNGTPIGGNKSGSSEAVRPLVLLHGHTANRFFVKPIFDYFERNGRPAVMFDWRGHGSSEKGLKGTYKLDILKDDLCVIYKEFLIPVFGCRDFYLLGHSMGGFVALKYTTEFPESVNRLVLMSTCARLIPNFLYKLWYKITLWWVKRHYEKWFNNKKKSHEKIGLEFFPQWSDMSLRPDPDAAIELLEDFATYDMRKVLKSIECPVLITVGDKDIMKKAIPQLIKVKNPCVKVLKGYGHNLPIEAGDIIGGIIADFLDGKIGCDNTR